MIAQFPFFRQLGELDCGITCLKMISDYFGKSLPFSFLQKKLTIRDEGVSLKDISDVADQIGLRTMGVRVNFDRLKDDLPTPCIAYWRKQHYVVVYHVTEEYVWIADPATRGIYIQSKESFQQGWICDPTNQSGILLLFETTPVFYESKNPNVLELSR